MDTPDHSAQETINDSPEFVLSPRHYGTPSSFGAASLGLTRLLAPAQMNSLATTDQHVPPSISTPRLDFLNYDMLLDDFNFFEPSFGAGASSLAESPAATPLTSSSSPGHREDTAQVLSNNISALSDALNCIIDNDAGLLEKSESQITALRHFLFSLWATFVGRIAPSLTPFGSHKDNPFLKYLVPKAQRSPEISIAILYLAYTMERRGRQDPTTAEGLFLEAKVEAILEGLERHDTVMSGRSDRLDNQNSQLVVTLSALLVFCMAFIANCDTGRFSSHLEYAIILCQTLFRTAAEDESFLYLAKLLGFMRNSLLFSSASTSINAPDYLSAALEFHDRNSDGLLEIDGCLQRCVHFRDLDLFSGMSASMASIVYTLGMLIKKKQLSLVSGSLAHGEHVRAFESDVDGLEIRLRRHLVLLSKRWDQQPSPADPRGVSLASCLNSYNEAVFWSSWTIFLTDLKDRYPATDIEVHDAAGRILDACSEVPVESEAAPLLLFPLAVGGMRTNKGVYREFVLNRLLGMSPVGITDTHGLCADLQNWWKTPGRSDSPIAFTSQFLF